MVLDEDVNGFRASQPKKRHVGKGKKNKVRPDFRRCRKLLDLKIQNKIVPAVPVWDPQEQYDPLRPNDYNEYKVWKQKERIDRRERMAEERRMEERKRMRRGGSYHSDSDFTPSEDEERPRKAGQCYFHFLQLFIQVILSGRYGETYDRWTRKDDNKERGPREDDQSVAMAVDRELTGDEAYQRRLAMSIGVRPTSPPEDNQPEQPQDEEPVVPGLVHDSHSPSTGEEAYLRRLAMSTMHRAQAPLQAPSPSPEPPRVMTPPPLSFNPFAPPSVPPPPPGDVPNAVPSGDIDAKKKAAAAIAAKLGALAAITPQPPAESNELPSLAEEKG
jgi:splicing factor 45